MTWTFAVLCEKRLIWFIEILFPQLTIKLWLKPIWSFPKDMLHPAPLSICTTTLYIDFHLCQSASSTFFEHSSIQLWSYKHNFQIILSFSSTKKSRCHRLVKPIWKTINTNVDRSNLKHLIKSIYLMNTNKTWSFKQSILNQHITLENKSIDYFILTFKQNSQSTFVHLSTLQIPLTQDWNDSQSF